MKYAKILLSTFIMANLLGCSTITALNPFASKVESETNQTATQTNATQGSGSVASSKSVAANGSASTSVLFTWAGVDKDMVSPNELKPDTKPDANFHITVAFSEPSAIKAIWIRHTEYGKWLKWGEIYNKNLPLAGYIMAVVDSKKNQILPQGGNGLPVEGVVDLDLYISELNNENGRDTHKFEKNQTYTLQIDYVTKNNVDRETMATLRIP